MGNPNFESLCILLLLFFQALLETVFGVKVIITGDAFVPGERSVIIMNHRTRMDWMFLWNCLMRYSYLRLEKICLKASLKSIPGFGRLFTDYFKLFIHFTCVVPALKLQNNLLNSTCKCESHSHFFLTSIKTVTNSFFFLSG